MFRRGGYPFAAENTGHAKGAKRDRDEGVDLKERRDAETFTVCQRPCPKRLLNYRWVTPYVKDPVTMAQIPPK